MVGMGCGEQSRGKLVPAAESPSVAEIAQSFTNYAAVSTRGALVNRELFLLCRGVTQTDLDMERKKHGPHTYTAITVFMNPPAAAAFAATNLPYPVGSVVVKQKALGWPAESEPGGKITQSAEGVGGMVKRAPGYDPEHGDWEYFYFEASYFYFQDPAKIEQGKIQSCVRCHAGAKATDHVFGTWERAKSAGR